MDTQLRNRLILSFYLPSALLSTAHGMLIPVLPVFGRGLTVTYILIGILLAAEPMGRVLGDIPAGTLIRRFGVRRTMLIGVAVIVASVGLLVFSQSIWTASLLLLVVGVGHASYNIARHAYIAAVVPNAQRGRAISVFGGVYRVGKFAGPMLGGWVAGSWELVAVFPVYVILSLLTGWFVWQFMEALPVEAKPKRKRNAPPPMVQVLQQNRETLAWAGGGQVLAMLTRSGWTVLIPLYAADALGLSVQTIGLIVGLGGACDMLFFYLSGVLMDRFGRKWAIVPSFTVQGIAVVLMVFTQSAFWLGGIAALIGFANATSSGTMMTLGSDLAPPDLRGEFLGLWRMVGDTGGVGAPLVVGGVAQVLALPFSILTIGGVGLCTALLFGLFVPETLEQRPITPVP